MRMVHGERQIARNTVWNFVGTALPVPVALVAVPRLLSGLGNDLFGLLTIAWAVMGYFSLFDLGLGRATTKYLADALHQQDNARVRQLFWSSITVNLALGLTGGAVLFALTPRLERALTISADLRAQTTVTFYLLAASVPIIVMTSVARGVLEGLQRFDLVNVVKIPASLVTYLGPLIALAFTNRLPPMILVIAFGRAAALATYLVMCFLVLPALRSPEQPTLEIIKPLASMGGWLTAATIVTPVIVSLDRFIIGSALSVGAVASYAAAYEVVTKLWIFSASLLGVLFPVFSVLTSDTPGLHRLYGRAVASLFVLTTPVVGIIVALSPEFFALWLGPAVGVPSAIVARLLVVGVLINVIAQVPFTVLQATGHADATGKLQLAALPFYALAAWVAAERWGVAGVAGIWTARATVDALSMFAAAAYRLDWIHSRAGVVNSVVATVVGAAFLVWCWLGVEIVSASPGTKIMVVFLSAVAFLYACWRQFVPDLFRQLSLGVR